MADVPTWDALADVLDDYHAYTINTDTAVKRILALFQPVVEERDALRAQLAERDRAISGKDAALRHLANVARGIIRCKDAIDDEERAELLAVVHEAESTLAATYEPVSEPDEERARLERAVIEAVLALRIAEQALGRTRIEEYAALSERQEARYKAKRTLIVAADALAALTPPPAGEGA
jgi:hypothetical protein